MADEREKIDLLFKSIAHGMYSDGTMALIFIPLIAPLEGETIEEAQKGALINTGDCIKALDSMVKSGFTIKASVVKGSALEQPIVLG